MSVPLLVRRDEASGMARLVKRGREEEPSLLASLRTLRAAMVSDGGATTAAGEPGALEARRPTSACLGADALSALTIHGLCGEGTSIGRWYVTDPHGFVRGPVSGKDGASGARLSEPDEASRLLARVESSRQRGDPSGRSAGNPSRARREAMEQAAHWWRSLGSARRSTPPGTAEDDRQPEAEEHVGDHPQ